jgi:cell division protein ZapA (FtsZ GTPase activity inhibitor)
MKVKITIRGRSYTVRSDEGDVDLAQIARYVDERMQQIARPGLDDYTVAMLAALNIAQDFARFRRDVDADLEGLDRDLASTAVLLETALPAASETPA